MRAPLVEAPLECRAAPQPPPRRRAGPRPPNWPAQRRPPLLLGTGAAMPVPLQRSNGLPKARSGAPPSFLWSFSPVSLAGGLLTAVAAFPLCAAFVRRCRVPLLWRWFREAASAQRLGGPGNKSNGFLQTLHKEERTGKSLQRPVAGVAALPVCWRLRSRGGRNNRCPPPAAQVDPTALATPEENSENGAYVYHVVPEAFRRELAKGFHAAIVAKALREHGHLNGELGRLAYLERLPGLGHQRVYHIQSSILAE
jgi:hypothetical protein